MAPELAQEINKGRLFNGSKKNQNLMINFEKSEVFSLGMLILQIYFGFFTNELIDLKKEIINDNKTIGSSLLEYNKEKEAPEDFCFLVSQMLSFDYSYWPRLTDK